MYNYLYVLYTCFFCTGHQALTRSRISIPGFFGTEFSYIFYPGIKGKFFGLTGKSEMCRELPRRPLCVLEVLNMALKKGILFLTCLKKFSVEKNQW